MVECSGEIVKLCRTQYRALWSPLRWKSREFLPKIAGRCVVVILSVLVSFGMFPPVCGGLKQLQDCLHLSLVVILVFTHFSTEDDASGHQRRLLHEQQTVLPGRGQPPSRLPL